MKETHLCVDALSGKKHHIHEKKREKRSKTKGGFFFTQSLVDHHNALMSRQPHKNSFLRQYNCT